MTREGVTTELNKMLPDNYVLKSRILNLIEQYAETAFKAGLETKFSDYESFAVRKKKRQTS
jgi:hypothetical protein